MKCPTCVDEGLRSVVVSHGSSTTLMAGSSFWDEDGKYHRHDPNTTTTSYSCSNDHRWTESRKSKCPACEKTNE